MGSPVHVTSIVVSGCQKVECGPHQIWFIVLPPRENQSLKYPVTIYIINSKIIFSFDMSEYSTAIPLSEKFLAFYETR